MNPIAAEGPVSFLDIDQSDRRLTFWLNATKRLKSSSLRGRAVMVIVSPCRLMSERASITSMPSTPPTISFDFQPSPPSFLSSSMSSICMLNFGSNSSVPGSLFSRTHDTQGVVALVLCDYPISVSEVSKD